MNSNESLVALKIWIYTCYVWVIVILLRSLIHNHTAKIVIMFVLIASYWLFISNAIQLYSPDTFIPTNLKKINNTMNDCPISSLEMQCLYLIEEWDKHGQNGWNDTKFAAYCNAIEGVEIFPSNNNFEQESQRIQNLKEMFSCQANYLKAQGVEKIEQLEEDKRNFCLQRWKKQPGTTKTLENKILSKSKDYECKENKKNDSKANKKNDSISESSSVGTFEIQQASRARETLIHRPGLVGLVSGIDLDQQYLTSWTGWMQLHQVAFKTIDQKMFNTIYFAVLNMSKVARLKFLRSWIGQRQLNDDHIKVFKWLCQLDSNKNQKEESNENDFDMRDL